MDPRVRAAFEMLKFLAHKGIIIASGTAGGGFMLGPAGLAIGAAAGGVGATVASVSESYLWGAFASSATAHLLSFLGRLISLDDVRELLRGVAGLISRLLREVGLLKTSEVHRELTYTHPRPSCDKDDEPGTAF